MSWMEEIVDKKCPNSAYHELDNMRQPHQNTSFNMNIFLCISMAYTINYYKELYKNTQTLKIAGILYTLGII